MEGEADRKASFSYSVGYFDGKKDHIIVANEVGFITDKPRGNDLHGWTELLYVYGHPSFPDRSLAELTKDEWDQYLKSIEDIDPFKTLADFLKKQKTK